MSCFAFAFRKKVALLSSKAEYLAAAELIDLLFRVHVKGHEEPNTNGFRFARLGLYDLI